jgi:hypothetical protein
MKHLPGGNRFTLKIILQNGSELAEIFAFQTAVNTAES